MKTQWLSSWHLFWALVGAYAFAWESAWRSQSAPEQRNPVPCEARSSLRVALLCRRLHCVLRSKAVPNQVTKWLRANRRFFGLAFAVGMGWHLTVVAFAFYTFHSKLSVRDFVQILRVLCFLFLLTLTSFRVVARRLSAVNWRRLHKVGVYVIWGLATHIYLGTIRNHGSLVDILFFAGVLAAWLVRIIAWIDAAPPVTVVAWSKGRDSRRSRLAFNVLGVDNCGSRSRLARIDFVRLVRITLQHRGTVLPRIEL